MRAWSSTTLLCQDVTGRPLKRDHYHLHPPPSKANITLPSNTSQLGHHHHQKKLPKRRSTDQMPTSPRRTAREPGTDLHRLTPASHSKHDSEIYMLDETEASQASALQPPVHARLTASNRTHSVPLRRAREPLWHCAPCPALQPGSFVTGRMNGAHGEHCHLGPGLQRPPTGGAQRTIGDASLT